MSKIRNVETDRVIAKASQAAQFVVQNLAMTGDSVQVPANTAEWESLYGRMVWAYSGIYAIATTIAQLGMRLYKVDNNTGEEVDQNNHPILNLLENPNPTMTGFDLFESLVVYLESTGCGYFEAVHERLSGKIVRVNELYSLRPSRITLVPTKDGKGIAKYVFQVKAYAKKNDFKPEDIIPFRYFSPDSDWLGQGALKASANEIVQDEQMVKWNIDFFKHGTSVESAIETDKTLTAVDMKNLHSMVEDFLVGKGRKTIILGKGLKYKPLGTSHKDVDFGVGRKANMDYILSCLGVPPAKVGMLEDTKFSNYQFQEQAFHRDTIIPKLKKIEGSLNNYLVPLFADLQETETHCYKLKFDTAPLLKEDQNALTERLLKQIAHGIKTPNEACKELGLDEYTGGDEHYIDSRLVPVGTEREELLERREDALQKALDDMENAVSSQTGLLEARMKKLEDE